MLMITLHTLERSATHSVEGVSEGKTTYTNSKKF